MWTRGGGLTSTERRQELQKDGSHGQQERSQAKGSAANLVGRAAHKGAPVEMGSKKPVSRFRVVSAGGK